MKSKELIPIRSKKLSDGRESLYLDVYRDGKRTYEFLRLYILPGKDPATKDRNRSTWAAARTIQADRILALQRTVAGIVHEGPLPFSRYVEESYLPRYGEDQKKYRALVVAGVKIWTEFAGEVDVKEIDRRMLLDFIRFLRCRTTSRGKPMASATQAVYYNVVQAVLNAAVRDGRIPSNPASTLTKRERIAGRNKARCFLTMDEVRILADTPCPWPGVKCAFLFACFTGLRWSDLVALTWGNIRDGHIDIVMKKTRERLRIPISANAARWLPEKTGERVFLMPSQPYTFEVLDAWATAAGLDKHVTMHVARHTFATLELTYGADLYTVSKLLGHRNVTTTQVYAKVVDQKKAAAIALVPDISQ